jgi:hypothetical protein
VIKEAVCYSPFKMADLGVFEVELAAAVIPELEFTDEDDQALITASTGPTSADIESLINKGAALDLPPPETPARPERPPSQAPAATVDPPTGGTGASRFKRVNADEINVLLQARQSENTRRNTNWGMKIFEGKNKS